MPYDDGLPSRTHSASVGAAPATERVITPDSLGRLLVEVCSRALSGRDGQDLNQLPGLSRPRGAASLAREQALAQAASRRAVPPEAADAVSGEAVAAWVVGHYPSNGYPAVVIGSPHGSAAHLAVTLGAPWLPAGFELTVRWPGGAADDPSAAVEHGAAVARRLLDANPGLSARQLHDPIARGRLAGTTVTLFARWSELPAAYRGFLSDRLAAGAAVVLVRDCRRWPVYELGGRHSVQLGGPSTGLSPVEYLDVGPDLHEALRRAGGTPARWRPPAQRPTDGFAEHGPERKFDDDLRRLAASQGWPLHRALYPQPAALSAAVATVVRDWLGAAGRSADRLAVECGRLLDPGQVLRTGLVPYWCEGALRDQLTEAEWWLAGSRAFRSVDVLVEPPGRRSSAVAPVGQWNALAWFGRGRGTVDRAGVRGYPFGALPTRHATAVLSGHLEALPVPPPPTMAATLAALRAGGAPGLLIC
jgi:hypothetical protein